MNLINNFTASKRFIPSGNSLTIKSEFTEFGSEIKRFGCSNIIESSYLDGYVKRLSCDDDWAKGALDFIRISDDMYIFLNNTTFFNDELCLKFNESNWVRIHFRIDASTTMMFDEMGEINLNGSLCTILHTPKDMVVSEWYNSSKPEGWLTLFCSRDYLVQLLGKDTVSLPVQLQHFLRGDNSDLLFESFPLTPPMARCLIDIRNIPFHTHIGKVHLEAQVMELVCLFFYNMFSAKNKKTSPIALSKNDIDAIHNTRKLLLDNISQPISIGEIPRLMGINRKKLSYGFKQVYQQTIADYLFQQRMQLAENLLRDGTQSIELVAQHVGYDHAANFSTAFKRYYGITPKKLVR
jgi:AraC-like DNA-binding protein